MTSLCYNLDDQLINFDNIHRSIRTQTFSFDLPSSVHHHTSTSNKRDCDTPEDDTASPSKCIPLQNTKSSLRWKLRNGEYYRAVFNNAYSKNYPKLDSVSLCHRWHIKGVCFTGCNLASIHHEIRDTSLQREMDLYCKLCCGE